MTAVDTGQGRLIDSLSLWPELSFIEFPVKAWWWILWNVVLYSLYIFGINSIFYRTKNPHYNFIFLLCFKDQVWSQYVMRKIWAWRENMKSSSNIEDSAKKHTCYRNANTAKGTKTTVGVSSRRICLFLLLYVYSS